MPKTGADIMREQASPAALTTKSLMLQGMLFTSQTSKNAPDWHGLNVVMKMTAAMIMGRVPEGDRPDSPDLVLARFMGTVGLQNFWTWKWAKFGYPTVILSPDQVAAFALSDVPVSVATSLRLPWPAFLVQVPSGSLPTGGNEVVRISFTWVDVGPSEERRVMRYFNERGGILRVHLRADQSDGTMLWATHKDMPDFAAVTARDTYGLLEMNSAEDRALALAKNVVLNTLVALDTRDGKEIQRTRKVRVPRAPKKVLVDTRLFVVGTPVKVGHKRTVRDYLSGTIDRVYTARWLVRGHWRNQACGPNRSERKHVFIEPYWKGPEGGPLRVRSHELEG